MHSIHSIVVAASKSKSILQKMIVLLLSIMIPFAKYVVGWRCSEIASTGRSELFTQRPSTKAGA